ncbi:hypothetical protein [Chondrinema litorale]|uniref:hypothetical protein n=1 Tax=Chondrinema litorale TaxID=2994555 RepID=UPI00254310FC|nr:hypothetical protein [Chondrinema litorale]UZR96311.1 hypothetical protein OQ292_21880 [Chondrinema litorale]
MNRKLFIPGKSKLSPLSLESAVLSYRLGMFSAAKVMSWYKISMNKLRQLNRNYYFQLEKTFAPMKQPNLKSDKAKVKQLEAELKLLQGKLQDAELESKVWKKMVEIAERELGVGIKLAAAKNSGIRRQLK